VMDNASIHRFDDVVDAICSIGALVRFLPPYSPDYNAIEFVFGEVKQYMQASDLLVDTLFSIPTILLMAFQSVSVENCTKYIIRLKLLCPYCACYTKKEMHSRDATVLIDLL